MKALSIIACACVLGASSLMATSPRVVKAFDPWEGRIRVYSVGYLVFPSVTVQVQFATPPFTSSQKALVNSDIAALISFYGYDATPVSGKGPTLDYNCHGYAWFYSNTWINQYYLDTTTDTFTSTPNLSIFWTSGTYSLIASSSGTIPSGVPNGAKVFYANGDHSAVKTSSTKFTSKWGVGGEYVHSPQDAPYSHSSLKYYN